MTRTTAFGLYDNCVLGLLERVTDHVGEGNVNLPRQRFWTIRSKHVIVGSGSLERHIAFNNKDVPGVIGKVGMVLGNRGVNIAEYLLSRTSNGGTDTAYAVVKIDEKLSDSLIGELKDMDEIITIMQLELFEESETITPRSPI